jgi:hypothetical protein
MAAKSSRCSTASKEARDPKLPVSSCPRSREPGDTHLYRAERVAETIYSGVPERLRVTAISLITPLAFRRISSVCRYCFIPSIMPDRPRTLPELRGSGLTVAHRERYGGQIESILLNCYSNCGLLQSPLDFEGSVLSIPFSRLLPSLCFEELTSSPGRSFNVCSFSSDSSYSPQEARGSVCTEARGRQFVRRKVWGRTDSDRKAHGRESHRVDDEGVFVCVSLSF